MLFDGQDFFHLRYLFIYPQESFDSSVPGKKSLYLTSTKILRNWDLKMIPKKLRKKKMCFCTRRRFFFCTTRRFSSCTRKGFFCCARRRSSSRAEEEYLLLMQEDDFFICKKHLFLLQEKTCFCARRTCFYLSLSGAI